MDAFEAISPAEPSAAAGRKNFTLAEANRALILVRRIVGDIVQHYQQLRTISVAYRSLEHAGDSDHVDQTRRQYITLSDRLSELREELEEIGCELKDFEIGLVDFLAHRDGREVYLCWKLGEEQVSHWHEINSGYGGRKHVDEKTR